VSEGQKWLAGIILLIFVVAINVWFWGMAMPWYIHHVG